MVGPTLGSQHCPTSILRGGGVAFDSWNGHQVHDGKRARICTLNCGSLPARWQQIVDQSFDLCCIQEARATMHHIHSIGGKIRSKHLCIQHGEVPQMKKYGHATMVERDKPGVLAIVKDSLQAAPLQLPEQCEHLYRQGRIHAMCVSSPLGEIVIVNCYFPSNREERHSMNQCVIGVLPWLMSRPCLIVGDFNESIESGAVGMELRSGGWFCPQLSGTPQPTFGQRWQYPDTVLDAIWISPHLRDYVHDAVVVSLPGLQHRMVGIDIALMHDSTPMYEWIPHPAITCIKKSKTETENIWSAYTEHYLHHLQDGDVDAAWSIWNEATVRCMHDGHSCPMRSGSPSFRRSQAQQLSSKVLEIQRQYQAGAIDDEQAAHLTQRARKREASHLINRWRKRLKASDLASGREFFAWLRGPPRLPPNTLTDQHGEYRGRAQCLQALRRYWGDIYRHDHNRKLTSILPSEGDVTFNTEDNDLLTQIVQSTSCARATGMDSWRCSEWRVIPQLSIDMLLLLYKVILASSRCPREWLIMKTVMMPKKQNGPLAVHQFRPIAVCGIPYRTFSKFLSVRTAAWLTDLDPRLCGGIRGRGAQQAWLDLAMRLERISLAEEDNPYSEVWPDLHALQIDTHKYFDSICIDKACRLMESIGIDDKVTKVWKFFVSNHTRHLAYGGIIDPNPLCATKGVPQGDSLSMVAGVLVMGNWASFLDTTGTAPCMRLFVDDRIMYHHNMDVLQNSLWETEKWDQRENLMSKEKTHYWGLGAMEQSLTWCDGSVLPLEKAPKYVGIPMMLPGRSASSCFADILRKGIALRDRLACAPIKSEKKLRYMLAIFVPSLLYPSLVVRPTSSQLASMRSMCRSITWSGSQFAASLSISLMLRKTHQYDPWMAMVCHCGKTIWHLCNGDEEHKASWCALWYTRQKKPITQQQHGLATTWLRDL